MYREFSMKEFWKNIENDPDVLSYLPDRNSQVKDINRKFAYSILATLRPGFANEVIMDAAAKRTSEISSHITLDQVTINDALL